MASWNDSGRKKLAVSSPDVLSLEAQLGAVQKHSQVIAVAPKRPADLILVAFLEKEPIEDLALLGRQSLENGPHVGSFLLARHRRLGFGAFSGTSSAHLVIQRGDARMRSIQLEQHVVADRVHETAKAARRLDPT